MTGQAAHNLSRIVALTSEGQEIATIAQHLGICIPYAKALAKSVGLVVVEAPKAKNKILACVRECADRGLTRNETAEAVGISYGYVALLARQHSIKFHRQYKGAQRGADKRSSQMAALYAAGYTLQQIGEQFHITRERVRQILTKYHGFNAHSGGAHKKACANREKWLASKNAYSLKKWGCTWAQYKDLRQQRTPTRAYSSQRRNAMTRGIAWEFNLWQWWVVWQESGHWRHRGRGQGYMMCRKGDVGPYSVDNVFIATGIENSSTGPHKKSGLPTGVSCKTGHSYAAHRLINGKKTYLGSFQTAELAHAAYLASFITNHVVAA